MRRGTLSGGVNANPSGEKLERTLFAAISKTVKI